MEQTTTPTADLFSDKLPSLDDLSRLSDLVHASETNILNFTQQVQTNMPKTSHLSAGIGLFMIGRLKDSQERLNKSPDTKEKFLYLSYIARRLGNYDQAITLLQKSQDQGLDTLAASMEKAATYRKAGNYEAAANQLKACANFQKVSAEYHYQFGRLQEQQGLYEEAMANYRTAIELLPTHQKALFHMAYRADLSGNEPTAVEYYRQILSSSPIYVNALLNLAVLYEDMGQFEKALQCVDKVLKFHPNHQRAILFRKDIESSQTMFYDEDKEKRRTRKNQILETPITDFELSVRSRNCLKKMNIRKIGDLLNISEADLLAFKNFGETSLREIKTVLESKSLQLGMFLSEKSQQIQEILNTPDEETPEEGMLSKSIDELQLSVRAKKCVQKLGIHTIGELVHKTEAELLGVKNFGVTSLNEIKKVLTSLGLT